MNDIRPPHRRQERCAWASATLLAASLAVGCSSPQGGVASKRGVEARWEPPAARLTAFAEWFRDLPDPVPGPAPYTAGASTIVVLPDTQVYTDVHPAIFERQTRWVAEHHEERDIRFVLHLGDVTETASPREWQSAQQAMGWLDGRVPYALATGNHDYGKHGHAESRESLLSTYFPVRAFLDDPTFGGTYNAGVLDNSFHLFSAGGRDWIALVLEWGPRHDVVQWADRVLAAHADRIAVVVTHAYLFHDDTRFDTEREDQPWNPHDYATAELPGGVYDGQELWDGLISRHGNVAMVLSGHVLGDGVGLLSSRGEQGHVVHQMLSNYQMLESGGQGYLRLLEILPDGETIQVKTYSPWLDDYKTEFDQQFRLRLDVKLEQPHRS